MCPNIHQTQALKNYQKGHTHTSNITFISKTLCTINMYSMVNTACAERYIHHNTTWSPHVTNMRKRYGKHSYQIYIKILPTLQYSHIPTDKYPINTVKAPILFLCLSLSFKVYDCINRPTDSHPQPKYAANRLHKTTQMDNDRVHINALTCIKKT